MTAPGLDRVAALVLGLVAEVSVRSLVLAGLAAAALACWRRAPAAGRSLVWRVVLYAAIAMPVLARATPPARVRASTMPVVTTAFADLAAPMDVFRARARAWLEPVVTGRTAPILTPPGAAADGPRSDRVDGLDALMLACVLYGAGVVGLGGRLLAGWVAARRLRRGAPIQAASVLARRDVHARRMGIGACPALVEQPALVVPMTSGVLRPVVALPADWREWPDETMDAVLAHELTHVARRDALTQLLSHANRALTWINPLSWWLHRHLADLAEQASDEAVLDAGVSRTTYAETLLAFASRRPLHAASTDWMTAMARHDALATERRIDRVLAWERPDDAGSRRGRRVVSAAAGLMAVALATVHVEAGRPSTSQGPAALAMAQVAAPIAVVHLEAGRPTSGLGPAAPAAAQAPAAPIAAGFGAGAFRPGGGMNAPVLLRMVEPFYTVEAAAHRIEGEIELEAVILTDGTVGDIRVSRSLDHTDGLDEAAVRAARQWVFAPGTLQGVPVPALVTLQLQFRLAAAKPVSGRPAAVYSPRPLSDDFAVGAYWSGSLGAVAPTAVAVVEPKYTAQALRDRLSGTVEVEIVVMPDGTVGNARVEIPLDEQEGLDDQALMAAQQCVFRPGRIGGTAVPMLATIDMNFRIH